MPLALSRFATGARFAFERMQGPERTLLAVSLLAWLGLSMAVTRGDAPLLCLSSPDLAARLRAGIESIVRAELILAELVAWLGMILAMMFPLLLHPVRHVALRSFPRRRAQAVGCFLAGYCGVWLAAGWIASLAVLALIVSGIISPRTLGTASLAIAAAWQLSRTRRLAMRRCHRSVPLVPWGWRADLDCLRFGAAQGRDCLVVCGPAMFAMLAAHDLLLCAALAILLFVERGRPDASAVPIAAFLAGIAAILLAPMG